MQVSPVGQLPDRGAWTYQAKLCLASRPAQQPVLCSGPGASPIQIRRVGCRMRVAGLMFDFGLLNLAVSPQRFEARNNDLSWISRD